MTTKATLTGNQAVEVVMAGLPKERTMTETKPCETGKHCERQARDLGACVAGMCFPPAPVGVPAAPAPQRCTACGTDATPGGTCQRKRGHKRPPGCVAGEHAADDLGVEGTPK
jgi:hypothetical protein